MSFLTLLSAVRARRRLFFLILLTTLGATLLTSLLVPKTYVSKASVLVDGKDEQSMRPGTTPERERAGYMQTQIDILTSPKVAQRVIRELKLAEDPAYQEVFAKAGVDGTIENWLAADIAKPLKIDTSQSSIVQVAYSADDAAVAAQMANSFAKAYVDTVLELRTEPNRKASAWFNEQIKGLRDNMLQAEQRLADFRQQNGIVSADERYDIENVRLSDLAALIARTREQSESAPSAAGADLLLSNPYLQSLRADLLRAEAKLQEMSTELGVRHPQYQRKLSEVQSLRAKVNDEIRSAAIQSSQSTQRSRLNRAQLLAEMEAQRERVLKLTQARNQMSALSREVTLAQRTYDDAMQRFAANSIDSRAVQTNVSIMDPAVAPLKPARPRILLNLGIALVMGSLLGLSAAFLLEMSDKRVRHVADLTDNPHVPVLAVLGTWNPAAERLLGMANSPRVLPGPG